MTPEAFRGGWVGKEWRKTSDKALGVALLAVLDEFARQQRSQWKPGDIKLGGEVLMARAQGHDDIRELFFKTLLEPPPVPESEPTYSEPQD